MFIYYVLELSTTQNVSFNFVNLIFHYCNSYSGNC